MAESRWRWCSGGMLQIHTVLSKTPSSQPRRLQSRWPAWAQRTREVIDIPAVPVQATEQVFIARICPLCEQRRTPRADLAGVALGKQLNLVSLSRSSGGGPAVAPFSGICKPCINCKPWSGSSVGWPGKPRVNWGASESGFGAVRWCDETGWRENGVNGYVWTFSLPPILPAPGAEQGGGGRGAGRGLRRGAGQRFLRRLPSLRRPQAALLGPPAAGDP